MIEKQEDQPRGEPSLRFVTENARFQHVFVVVRISKSLAGGDLDYVLDRLNLTKAFLAEDEANDEAARLNELNGDHWLYFVSVARLVSESDGEGTGPTG